MQKIFGLPVDASNNLDRIRHVYRERLQEALNKRSEIAGKFCSLSLLNRFDGIHGIITESLLIKVIEFVHRLIESDLLDKDMPSRSDICDFPRLLKNEFKEGWERVDAFLHNISENLRHVENSQNVPKATALAEAYIKYNSHFFKGKFVDRNGKGLEFSREELKSLAATGKSMYKSVKSGGGISLDESTGQFVSKIICLLFEFVFDEVFKIPFYCKEIAEAQNDSTQIGKQINAAITAISNKEADIQNLKEAPAPGTAQYLIRQEELKLQECDRILFSLNNKKSDLNNVVGCNNGVAGCTYGGQVDVFTCCAAGLIPNPICNIKLNGTGDDDYSALVGELTAMSSIKAASYVKSAVGPAIKGAGIFSTNNEALTEIIASTLGIITKKQVEYIVYNASKDIITNNDILPNGIRLPAGNTYTKKELLNGLNKLHLD